MFFHLLESQGCYNAILLLTQSNECDLYCGKIPPTAVLVQRFVVDALLGHRMWLRQSCLHTGVADAPCHITPLTFCHLLTFFCAHTSVCPGSVSSLQCTLIARSLGFQQSLIPEALHCSLMKILYKMVLQIQVHPRKQGKPLLTWEINPVGCVDCCHTAIQQCLIWVLQYLLERALHCTAVMAPDNLLHSSFIGLLFLRQDLCCPLGPAKTPCGF